MVSNKSAIAVILLACTFIGQVTALGYNSEGAYDGFKITWGEDSTNRNYFKDLPLYEAEARKLGWTQINKCNGRKPWKGRRYALMQDFSVVLLYDVVGFIAGIQIGVRRNYNYGFPSKEMRRYFVREGRYFYSTVYFLHPAAICTSGRPNYRVNTAYDLEVQTGPTWKKLRPLPYQLHNRNGWTKSKCFPTMGTHYFSGLTPNTSCTNYFPMFVLFNGTELAGFGWFLQTFVSSYFQNFERLHMTFFHNYWPEEPKCFIDGPIHTTMHVFLKNNISAIQC